MQESVWVSQLSDHLRVHVGALQLRNWTHPQDQLGERQLDLREDFFVDRVLSTALALRSAQLITEERDELGIGAWIELFSLSSHEVLDLGLLLDFLLNSKLLCGQLFLEELDPCLIDGHTLDLGQSQARDAAIVVFVDPYSIGSTNALMQALVQ